MGSNIHWYDLIVLDDKVNNHSVIHIDGNGVKLTKFTLQFMKSQRWMIGVDFQYLNSFYVSFKNLRMFFDELL